MTVGIPGEEVPQTAAEWVTALVSTFAAALVFVPGWYVVFVQMIETGMITTIHSAVISGLAFIVYFAILFLTIEKVRQLFVRFDFAIIDENDRLVFNRDWDSSVVGE